ncbi:MaoC family dehydratase [Halosolutus halophilus]|uniref:MaoC family dehydratase n=1 Tax=Halosolutus halophilus TaxID=1552990 RepID=UPI002234F3F4|nr:MaoC/PaaZ C-terminal domain-containing protein [Halosolutus halophilus]
MTGETLSEGDSIPPKTIDEVRESDTKLLAAILQDPYPPHFNPKRADELGYPDLLHQGPANLSYLLQAVTAALESPTDVRSFDVRYDDMVFVGQTVRATATVEETRVENGEGVVTFAVALENDEGDVAVGGTVEAAVPLDRIDAD